MKRSVYLDTTIPSFLFDTRENAEVRVKRRLTLRWWSLWKGRVEAVVSDAVVAELEAGDYSHRQEALRFVAQLRALEIVDEVLRRAAAYVRRKVMPDSPDAVHLAVASFYRCAFLASWNMRHLVNPNKWEHIRRVNDLMGWHSPSLQTPEMMLEGETP